MGSVEPRFTAGFLTHGRKGRNCVHDFTVMALLIIAGLLANYVLFKGSAEVVDPLADRSVKGGKASDQAESER